jgi:hypothetical protein
MDPAKPDPAIEPIVVSPRTACVMLAIGKTQLFALLKDGVLESIKIGKSRRITVASIKKLAAEGTPTGCANGERRKRSQLAALCFLALALVPTPAAQPAMARGQIPFFVLPVKASSASRQTTHGPRYRASEDPLAECGAAPPRPAARSAPLDP